MFLKNSRYYGVPSVTSLDADGRPVQVLKLRRLNAPAGARATVKGSDQLDVMAEQRYQDAGRFWHIADANTELEADALLHPDGRVILIP